MLAILQLLEDRTASAFRDEFLLAPINASHASFLATANSIDSIPEPLLSRFIVIEVPELTHQDRIRVTTSIYRELRVSEPYGHFFTLTPESTVVEAMARNEMLTPRLVRQHFKLAMQQACRHLDRAPHPGSLVIERSTCPTRQYAARRDRVYVANTAAPCCLRGAAVKIRPPKKVAAS